MVRQITLTNSDCVALVDDEDFDRLNQWKWHLSFSGSYVVRYARFHGKSNQVRMHRVVLDAPDGVPVDHANNDKLDNRRTNLRLCTPSQNVINRPSPCRHGFRGITPYRLGGWRASIRIGGRSTALGIFKTPEEAARAYDAAAAIHHGEFARLNFPGAAEVLLRDAPEQSISSQVSDSRQASADPVVAFRRVPLSSHVAAPPSVAVVSAPWR